MFNPSMFENAKKNMNKDQMRQAAEMMSKMSDAELLNYAKMTGMPITDVKMMRQSADMMKNMDDQQFQSYKNMAQNMNYPGYGQQPTTQQQSTTTNTRSAEYAPLEKLKSKGNDLFKQGKYQEASTTYTECLLEIEEIKAKEKTTNQAELDNLEISVRLNLANVKSKLDDYEAVLTQAKTVLKMSENGKAYFRAAQALHHFGKNRAALDHLEKAKQLLQDDPVLELYNKVKQIVDEDDKKSGKTAEAEINTEKTEESEQSKEAKKSRMKKKNIEEGGDSSFKPTYTPKPAQTTSDTNIEEEKYEARPTSNPTPTPSFGAGPTSGNLDPENIKKSQEQLKNMDPDQLKTMTETFKTMDNSFIRQMLKSQTGMDMSDEDIQRMKTFMTPDMLKNMSNIDPSQIPNMKRNTPTSSSSPQTTSTSSTATTTSTQPSAQPSMADMMAGGMPNISGDMIKNMIDMLSSNPEMLKSMANMLGENNPLANMIKNKSPEELKKMMGWIKKLSKVVLFFSPVYRVVKNYWQLIVGLLVGYILYVMFGSS